MKVPPKALWKVTASSGDPRPAIDDRYVDAWSPEPSQNLRLEIDLGAVATLGGLEIYWGRRAARSYVFESSLDGRAWTRLCGTTLGEGGQEVFAFPPSECRFLRWNCAATREAASVEIVEINLYDPTESATTLEAERLVALGRGPIDLPRGESVTVDLGYVRSTVGMRAEWGERFGKEFSAHVSECGVVFREMGRIVNGKGGSDGFWWSSANVRFLRLTLHEANAPEGAILRELKLRILDRDRMPIGELERAASAGRSELYPQALLGRQVYWTALGEFDHPGEALFDEYGDLEPQRGFAQLTPLLRLDDHLHGAPASPRVRHALLGGSLPIPSVTWSADGLEICATALAHAGQAYVEYRILNRSRALRQGALALAVRPAQINPYWQHGGHARIDAVCVEGFELRVNGRAYAAFSREPDVVTIADFDGGDVVRLIEHGAVATSRELRGDSGLLSAACEFAFSLRTGASAAVVVASPLRDGVAPRADIDFPVLRREVARAWRRKIGPRKISVGDREVSDTVEAQTALILMNATRTAFRPGPRNYDRIWIRDGSSQALALLWAGLVEEAKAFVLWYAQRIYPNGMVPPILDEDGSINRGYGADIEYDAQGEFVCIAAEVFRISKDRAFLAAILEPVIRATKFIEALCARTKAAHDAQSALYGLLAPSISHERFSTPFYSYWDDYYALSAWRNCEYLAREAGDAANAARAKAKGEEFAQDLSRSQRLTAETMGKKFITSAADLQDVDPTSTSIAFEPCRVEEVLPNEFLGPTYDRCAADVASFSAPGFEGSFTPYLLRNLNALVALGRQDDAQRLLEATLSWRRPKGWRLWAEVVWCPSRRPDYIGDMPHTWIGAEFAAAIRRMLVREDCDTLQLFRAAPDGWWNGEGVRLRGLPTSFGTLDLRARRESKRATVELSLSGPQPARVTFRLPGAKRAEADGSLCEFDGDVITSQTFRRLVIDL